MIDQWITCKECRGSGVVTGLSYTGRFFEPYEDAEGTCPKCKGAGEVEVMLCVECEKVEGACTCMDEYERQTEAA